MLNNLLINKNSDVIKEWHPTKNENGLLEKITFSNGRKVWWLCSICNGEWQAEVKSRTVKKSGCPFCSGSKVSATNCLFAKRPDIAKQWHPFKNGNLTSKDITYGSKVNVWWKCNKCSMDWQAKVNKRTLNQGCPYCAGQKVCELNCLSTLRPDVSKEWNFIKNNDLLPNQFVLGSPRKVWWGCSSCNHVWISAIRDRTYKNSGCPKCSESKGEKEIALFLEQNKINFIKEAKFPTCKHISYLRFDFQLQIDNKILLIEYNGKQHYETVKRSRAMTDEHMEKMLISVQRNDGIKREWAIANNIPLLIIPYWDRLNMKQIILNFLKESSF